MPTVMKHVFKQNTRVVRLTTPDNHIQDIRQTGHLKAITLGTKMKKNPDETQHHKSRHVAGCYSNVFNSKIRHGWVHHYESNKTDRSEIPQNTKLNIQSTVRQRHHSVHTKEHEVITATC